MSNTVYFVSKFLQIIDSCPLHVSSIYIIYICTYDIVYLYIFVEIYIHMFRSLDSNLDTVMDLQPGNRIHENQHRHSSTGGDAKINTSDR